MGALRTRLLLAAVGVALFVAGLLIGRTTGGEDAAPTDGRIVLGQVSSVNEAEVCIRESSSGSII